MGYLSNVHSLSTLENLGTTQSSANIWKRTVTLLPTLIILLHSHRSLGSIAFVFLFDNHFLQRFGPFQKGGTQHQTHHSVVGKAVDKRAVEGGWVQSGLSKVT